jgi:hypothetical protein
MEIIALRKSIHEKLKNISCNTFDEIVPYVQCRMFNNLGLAALPTEKYTEVRKKFWAYLNGLKIGGLKFVEVFPPLRKK